MTSSNAGDMKHITIDEQFSEANRLKKSKPKEAFKLFESIVKNYKDEKDNKQHADVYRESLMELATAYDGEWKGVDKNKDKAYFFYKKYYQLNRFDKRVKDRVENREALINAILKTKDEKDEKKVISELQAAFKVNPHLGASSAADENKKTPLMYAAQCGNIVALKWILENRVRNNKTGGDVYLRDNDGHNALEYSVMFEDNNDKDVKSESIIRQRQVQDFLINFSSNEWRYVYGDYSEYPLHIANRERSEIINKLIDAFDAHRNIYFLNKIIDYMDSKLAYDPSIKNHSHATSMFILLRSGLEKNNRELVQAIIVKNMQRVLLVNLNSIKEHSWYLEFQPYFLKYHTNIIEALLETTNPAKINQLLEYREFFKDTVFNEDSYAGDMLEKAYGSKKVSIEHLILLHRMINTKGIKLDLTSHIFFRVSQEFYLLLEQDGDFSVASSIISNYIKLIDDNNRHYFINMKLDEDFSKLRRVIERIGEIYNKRQADLSLKVRGSLKTDFSKSIADILIYIAIDMESIAKLINTVPLDPDKFVIFLNEAMANVNNNKKQIVDRIFQLNHELLKSPLTPDISSILDKMMNMTVIAQAREEAVKYKDSGLDEKDEKIVQDRFEKRKQIDRVFASYWNEFSRVRVQQEVTDKNDRLASVISSAMTSDNMYILKKLVDVANTHYSEDEKNNTYLYFTSLLANLYAKTIHSENIVVLDYLLSTEFLAKMKIRSTDFKDDLFKARPWYTYLIAKLELAIGILLVDLVTGSTPINLKKLFILEKTIFSIVYFSDKLMPTIPADKFIDMVKVADLYAQINKSNIQMPAVTKYLKSLLVADASKLLNNDKLTIDEMVERVKTGSINLPDVIIPIIKAIQSGKYSESRLITLIDDVKEIPEAAQIHKALLDTASGYGMKDLVIALIKNNVLDKDNADVPSSALTLAIQHGHIEIVKILLRNGARFLGKTSNALADSKESNVKMQNDNNNKDRTIQFMNAYHDIVMEASDHMQLKKLKKVSPKDLNDLISLFDADKQKKLRSLAKDFLVSQPDFKGITLVERVAEAKKAPVVSQPVPAVVVAPSGLYPKLPVLTSSSAAVMLVEDNNLKPQQSAPPAEVLASREQAARISLSLATQGDPKSQSPATQSSVPENSALVGPPKVPAASAGMVDVKHVQSTSSVLPANKDDTASVVTASVADKKDMQMMSQDESSAPLADAATQSDVAPVATFAKSSKLFVKQNQDKVLVDEVHAWKNMLYVTLEPRFIKNVDLCEKCRDLAMENLNKIAAEDSSWAVIVVRIVAEFNVELHRLSSGVQKKLM
jgi:ankyrin repeat protein